MPPPTPLRSFYYKNTNRLHITNARSQIDGGGVLSNVPGTAQVLDKDMNVIVGQDPVVLVALAAPGEYEALFPPDVPVTLGQFVNILILIEGGPDLKYRGVITAKVIENVA